MTEVSWLRAVVGRARDAERNTRTVVFMIISSPQYTPPIDLNPGLHHGPYSRLDQGTLGAGAVPSYDDRITIIHTEIPP
jgi:hypothetical protein